MYAPIGPVSSSKNYILRFSTLGTTEKGVVRASFRKTDSPWSRLIPAQSKSFGTSRVDHEFLIKAPTQEERASWQIDILDASGTTYIDNVEVYEVDVTDSDIKDQVQFIVNASKSDSTVFLDGKYFSVKNKIYNDTITLQPYSSAVLMKYKGNIKPTISDQCFLVPDNRTTETLIGTVLASDPEGQTLTYSILRGNTDGAFTINSLTGEITVANADAPGPEFNLIVQVQDNGTGNLSSHANITIGIPR
jgi:hypothetical protein